MVNVKALILLFIFSLFVLSCDGSLHTWRVAIVGIPSRISPRDIHLLTTSYIIKQTHEPLFKKDGVNSYLSTILDSWSRGADYSSYKLCVGKPKKFSVDRFFKTADLKIHIEKVFNKYSHPKYKMNLKDDCLEIEFSEAYRSFLEIMSDLENSPSLPSSIAKVDDGLGDFQVVVYSKDLVKLKRKTMVRGFIEEVYFYDIEAIKHDKELLSKLDDINHVFLSSIKDIPKAKFTFFDYKPLKEYVLLINHPDVNLRKAIFNCINIEQLRLGAYLDETNYIDISTLIPFGIPGGERGLISRDCRGQFSYRKFRKKPIELKIWENIDEEKIYQAFSSVFVEPPKQSVSIKKESYTELIKDVSQKNYDLFLVVVDTQGSSYVPFFEYVFDEARSFLNFESSEGHRLFRILKETRDFREQLSIALELQKIIFAENLVLPLYQPIRRFYYPKKVSGVFVLDDFLDFPQLNKVRY